MDEKVGERRQKKTWKRINNITGTRIKATAKMRAIGEESERRAQIEEKIC